MSKYKLSHLYWNLSHIHVLNKIEVPTLSVYEFSACNTVRELCQLRDFIFFNTCAEKQRLKYTTHSGGVILQKSDIIQNANP